MEVYVQSGLSSSIFNQGREVIIYHYFIEGSASTLRTYEPPQDFNKSTSSKNFIYSRMLHTILFKMLGRRLPEPALRVSF
jgi:hypothetical protein